MTHMPDLDVEVLRSTGDGVAAVVGTMVDSPVRARARHVLLRLPLKDAGAQHA
jgi:hypothetical protein